jgi:hypothetical protein
VKKKKSTFSELLLIIILTLEAHIHKICNNVNSKVFMITKLSKISEYNENHLL